MHVARASVISILRNVVRSGFLRVEDAQGVHEFGSPKSELSVHLKVLSENFWMRMLQYVSRTLVVTLSISHYYLGQQNLVVRHLTSSPAKQSLNSIFDPFSQ